MDSSWACNMHMTRSGCFDLMNLLCKNNIQDLVCRSFNSVSHTCILKHTGSNHLSSIESRSSHCQKVFKLKKKVLLLLCINRPSAVVSAKTAKGTDKPLTTTRPRRVILCLTCETDCLSSAILQM